MRTHFHISLTGGVDLAIADIWPDGDAPENPTAEDVVDLLRGEGDLHKVLIDWSLDDAFDWEVT